MVRRVKSFSSESDHGDVVELAAAGGMGANLLDEHLAGSGRSRGRLDQHAVEPGVAESLVLQIERVGHSVGVRIRNLLIVAFARNGTVIPYGEFLIEPDFHRLAVFIGVA